MITAFNWARDIDDQDTIFFCDNLGAVHSLAGGVANAQDLQVLVSTTHVVFAILRCRWLIEWLPSESNCSDGLSRLGARDPWHQQRGLSAERLRLPPWLRSLASTWDQFLELVDAHFASSDGH